MKRKFDLILFLQIFLATYVSFAQNVCGMNFMGNDSVYVPSNRALGPHKVTAPSIDIAPIPLPHSKHIIGDMNDDGQLTAADVKAMTDAIAGRGSVKRLEVAGPVQGQSYVIIGDMNFDGQLTAADVVVLIETLNGRRHIEYIARDGSTYHQDSMGHSFVDLGLPSGTLWATCNVGAIRPEEIGDSYGWGQLVSGSVDFGSKEYNHIFEKYEAEMASLTELAPEDDIAFQEWGSDWRIPSVAQYQELFNGCNIKRIVYNGVVVLVFTSRINGNFIMFPSGGWTRTHMNDRDRAFSAAISSSSVYMKMRGYTLDALPIRPVHVPVKELEEHRYVDLALPSGTLWATTNVGAVSSEQSGDYFAWGEVASKSSYTWSNYRYCQGTGNSLTKYCTDSRLGHVDSKKELDYEDDAAYYNWGPDWCIPTYDQISEVLVYCNVEACEQNGVFGRKFTSTFNGKSIFIPCSGWKDGSTIHDAGSTGIYYRRDGYANAAGCLYMYTVGKYTPDVRYRYYGQTIRPVRVQKEHEYVDLGLTSGTLWATTNIGAQSEEEFGNYFAWGEVVPKDDCSPDNYKYALNGYAVGSTYTKYCLYERDGIVDNKTELDLEDDAAYINWGADWRIPSGEQLDELRKECTWEKCEYRGVTGYRIKSKKNDNSIFLPAAGYQYGHGIDEFDWRWYYRSSSLAPKDPSAYSPQSNVTQIYLDVNTMIMNHQRFYGYPVRPVRAATLFTEDIVLDPKTIATFVGRKHQLQATVTPASAASKPLTWTCSNPSVVSIASTGNTATITALANGMTTITVSNGSVSATCTIKVSPDFGSDPPSTPITPTPGGNDTDDYVDLGLSVKWATKNVGASRPEEFGNYYAWGETYPKDIYNWSTYWLCDGTYTALKKYVTSASFGAIDNKAILDSEDDAAYVYWKGLWRMPTRAEQDELRNNCVWIWSARNGINGWEVISRINGNSIFLPAAGYRMDDSYYSAGSQGYYWSCSLDESNSTGAGCFYFNSSNVSLHNYSRQCGFSVRPVYDASLLVESITISPATIKASVGEKHQLTATITPASAANKSVTWSSSNPSIASVSNTGLVTACANGSAIITAMINDGSGMKAQCTVTVANTDPQPKTFTVNGVTFTMIPVEHGSFRMGLSADGNNVTPVHNVTISKDYYIGETEVTQALWRAVMGKEELDTKLIIYRSLFGSGDNFPRYAISWDDCQEFITKLNAATGHTFRMPTEAEWEFAAKGGNKSRSYIYSGSNIIKDVAWYADNSDDKTHIVASKQPNELGIYDMSGNLWEWCGDWYGNYSSSSVTNPTGAISGSVRVARGGGWSDQSIDCRTVERIGYNPTYRDRAIGFRLALDISDNQEGKNHYYVDLGLPSGTLWATCNVGADNPEDYGHYFAWGEVEPKSTYNWSTYKYCNGSYNSMTKYSTQSSYGIVDNKTELDLEDDAAYMNWGAGWRMPSDAQWSELRSNCTWTWDSTKKGYTVVGPNKSSLFLPAAGFYDDSSLNLAGSYGNYWSRSLFSGSSSSAYGVDFESSNVSRHYYYRYFGLSVRPVRQN